MSVLAIVGMLVVAEVVRWQLQVHMVERDTLVQVVRADCHPMSRVSHQLCWSAYPDQHLSRVTFAVQSEKPCASQLHRKNSLTKE